MFLLPITVGYELLSRKIMLLVESFRVIIGIDNNEGNFSLLKQAYFKC